LQNTREADFYTQDGAEILIPIMHLDSLLRKDFSETLKSQMI